MSEKIRVRAIQGRVAYSAYRDGDLIPHDKPKLVRKTPWIERLLEYGDIVEDKGPVDKPADSTAKHAAKKHSHVEDAVAAKEGE